MSTLWRREDTEASNNSTVFFLGDSSPLFSYAIPGTSSSPWTAGYARQSDGYDETLHLSSTSHSAINFNITASSITLLIPSFEDCRATIRINSSSPIPACAQKNEDTDDPFTLYNLPLGIHAVSYDSGPVSQGEQVVFWGIGGIRPAEHGSVNNVTVDDSFENATGRLGRVVDLVWEGEWEHQSEAQKGSEDDFKESLSVTTTAGAKVTFSGQGSAIYVYGPTGPDYGSASISLDGGMVASANLTAPWMMPFQLLWFMTGLDATVVHNLTMVNLMDKKMAVDFFLLSADEDVLSQLTPSPSKDFVSTIGGRITCFLVVPLLIIGLASLALWQFCIRRRRTSSPGSRSDSRRDSDYSGRSSTWLRTPSSPDQDTEKQEAPGAWSGSSSTNSVNQITVLYDSPRTGMERESKFGPTDPFRDHHSVKSTGSSRRVGPRSAVRSISSLTSDTKSSRSDSTHQTYRSSRSRRTIAHSEGAAGLSSELSSPSTVRTAHTYPPSASKRSTTTSSQRSPHRISRKPAPSLDTVQPASAGFPDSDTASTEIIELTETPTSTHPNRRTQISDIPRSPRDSGSEPQRQSQIDSETWQSRPLVSLLGSSYATSEIGDLTRRQTNLPPYTPGLNGTFVTPAATNGTGSAERQPLTTVLLPPVDMGPTEGWTGPAYGTEGNGASSRQPGPSFPTAAEEKSDQLKRMMEASGTATPTSTITGEGKSAHWHHEEATAPNADHDTGVRPLSRRASSVPPSDILSVYGQPPSERRDSCMTAYTDFASAMDPIPVLPPIPDIFRSASTKLITGNRPSPRVITDGVEQVHRGDDHPVSVLDSAISSGIAATSARPLPGTDAEDGEPTNTFEPGGGGHKRSGSTVPSAWKPMLSRSQTGFSTRSGTSIATTASAARPDSDIIPFEEFYSSVKQQIGDL